MSRIALVTGGTRGIGASISKALKNAGHNVAANFSSNEEAAKKFSEETGVETFKWNVADYEQCKKGVEEVTKKLGPIEILVNNAGITRDSTLHKMPPEKWLDVINTNLNSLFNMTQNVINSMREKGFGRIINISSVNGQKGQIGQSNYAATKAGMIGFSKSQAQESASKGITVNVIAPGYINTEMVAAIPEEIKNKIISTIPVGRLGEADEIAKLAVYLAADESSYITGSTVSINGGQYFS